MSHRHEDLLLEWVSERGAGSWADIKASWEFVTGSAKSGQSDPAERGWVMAANLNALAHIEMSWSDGGRWAAAPPVLTMLPNSGGRALLTGARTRSLYWASDPRQGGHQSGALCDAADELDLWVDAVPLSNAPVTVLISCNEPGDAKELANRCGIAYSYSVSDQLSHMLPSLATAQRAWQAGPLPQGFPIDEFDPVALRWVPLQEGETVDGSPGLYRARTWDQHIHVLVTATGASFRVQREPGIYEVLRWDQRTVLEYDEQARELWVPAYARLPLMQERAAVLCTGRLPRRRESTQGHRGHAYENVRPGIADRIARSLSQDIG